MDLLIRGQCSQPDPAPYRRVGAALVAGSDSVRLGAMSEVITKLIPILHVLDPGRERAFYESLGLRTTYEGSEYPDFLAVGNDHVEFGLSMRANADPSTAGITWQLGVTDVDAVIALCNESGLDFEVITERPREDWTYRVVKVRSPNGFEVLLEEQGK